MQANACTLAGFAALDSSDIEAIMRMNEDCLARLLDPVLWAWVLGITLVCLLGGALSARVGVGTEGGGALDPHRRRPRFASSPVPVA